MLFGLAPDPWRQQDTGWGHDVVWACCRSLEIGDNKTRVGVMAMTESSRTVIHLSHHNNGPSLLAAIRGIDYTGGAPEQLGKTPTVATTVHEGDRQ